MDIAFISQFGSRSGEAVNQGDLYTMNTFGRRLPFPCTEVGERTVIKILLEEAQQKNVPTQVKCAEARGDRFFYGNGVIAKSIKGEHDE